MYSSDIFLRNSPHSFLPPFNSIPNIQSTDRLCLPLYNSNQNTAYSVPTSFTLPTPIPKLTPAPAWRADRYIEQLTDQSSSQDVSDSFGTTSPDGSEANPDLQEKQEKRKLANRIAQRKSRERRDHMREELLKDNNRLKEENAALKGQLLVLKEMKGEMEHSRIEKREEEDPVHAFHAKIEKLKSMSAEVNQTTTILKSSLDMFESLAPALEKLQQLRSIFQKGLEESEQIKDLMNSRIGTFQMDKMMYSDVITSSISPKQKTTSICRLRKIRHRAKNSKKATIGHRKRIS